MQFCRNSAKYKRDRLREYLFISPLKAIREAIYTSRWEIITIILEANSTYEQ